MTVDMSVSDPDQTQSTSDLLLNLGDQIGAETITIGQLVDALKDRAFGLILLILALPCCIPFLYGVPQAVSIPLVFVAGQILLGRSSPWLPERLRARSFSREAFDDMAQKAAPYIRWFEVIAKPRLTWLTHGLSERVLGLFLLIFSASIATPLPLTNTVPGAAVAVMALGFIERDGLLILFGTVVGIIWVTLLVLLGSELAIIIKDWVSSLFGG